MHTEIQPGEPTQASWLTHSWQGCDRTVMVTEGLGTHMIFSVENNHDGRIYRVQASDAKCFVCVTTALGGGTQEEARAPGAESLAPSHGGQIPQCRATGVPSTPASPQAPGRHLAKGREAPHDSPRPQPGLCMRVMHAGAPRLALKWGDVKWEPEATGPHGPRAPTFAVKDKNHQSSWGAS